MIGKYKLGLKLWSLNTDAYFEEAKRLYEESRFDYVELYIIPESVDTLRRWKTLNVPFTIHAPHYAHGVNLARDEFEPTNRKVYHEVKEFADELGADYIIFHGGNRGTIDSTIRQLTSFEESRAIIENKPYHTLKDKLLCVGITPQQIERIKREVGCEFCLDFGHALCSANSQDLEPYAYIEEFSKLSPVMYHVSGVESLDSRVDTHLNLRNGKLDPNFVGRILPKGAKVSIETVKKSKENLFDFEEDLEWMNSL